MVRPSIPLIPPYLHLHEGFINLKGQHLVTQMTANSPARITERDFCYY